MSKNIAIITAAGIGSRMGQDIPKQFITINNKPIIIYTMEIFERHPDIDAIIVACLSGWENILQAYAKQFNITKLTAIVKGGKTGYDSIHNGLIKAKELYGEDENIVIIQDGNRPLTSEEMISDGIAKCKQYGNAIAAIPCTEVLLTSHDGLNAEGIIDRDIVKRTQTPHTFYLKDILSAHEEARKKGIETSAASCSLYAELGKKLYFSAGSEKNIKLTTKEDIDIFKALLNVKKDYWIK